MVQNRIRCSLVPGAWSNVTDIEFGPKPQTGSSARSISVIWAETRLASGVPTRAKMPTTTTSRLDCVYCCCTSFRGALKYNIKAFSLAVKDLTEAVAIDCKCSLAYFNRAVCYHEMRFFQKVC